MLSDYHSQGRMLFTNSWKLGLIGVLFISALWWISGTNLAQGNSPTTPEPICQIYHLSGRLPSNIFSEPSTSSSVIGRAQPDTNLCIYGVVEGAPNWYEINPQPESDAPVVGFIEAERLSVGEPGTIANPNIYCDAWQVVRSTDINVRACAGTSCSVVTTLNPSDIICVDDYDYSGANWSFITDPASNVTGWLPTNQLSYIYDESTGCPDNSYRTLAPVALHSCADDACSTGNTFQTGTRVCVESDQFEGATWVRYSENNVPVGWIRTDLLEPIESDLDLETVSLTQDVNFAPNSVEINTVQEPQQNEPVPTTTPNNAVIAQASTPTPNTGEGVEPNATAVPGVNGQVGFEVCPVGTNPVVEGQCVTVTPSPFGLTPQPGNGLLLAQNVTLQSLFVENLELVSPQGSAEFFFVLPDDWLVRGPVTLVLDVNYSENVSSFTDEVDASTATLASRLDVRLDEVLVSSLNLNADDVGRRQIEIILPTEILADPDTRFHNVTLELNARDYCRVNAETRLSINAQTSYMRAVYEEVVPTLELGRYPIPFYNSPIGAETEAVWFVLPDNPTDEHLQVAASIAAGLGRLTGDDLDLNTVTASQVSAELYRNNNLIIIGEPNSNALVNELYTNDVLPTARDATGNIIVDDLALASNEGLIQLAPNPQNANRTIMVVTAQDNTGLQRAGQALAGPPSLIGLSGEFAVITDTTPRFRAPTPGENLPLGTYRMRDFGVNDNVVLTGSGLKSYSFNFDMPVGGPLRDDAYLEVLFNTTNSVNLDSSTLSILINNVPVSGVALSQIVDETQAIDSNTNREAIQINYRPLRVPIPPDLILIGRSNTIQFVVDMQGDWGCELPNFIWSTISNNSLLFLPQELISDEDYFPLVSQFPIPFNVTPNLEDVWVSLSESPSQLEIQQMVRTMSYLGDTTPLAEGMLPEIHTGALPAGINLADYHYIVLGRPSQNSFLSELNPNLPQPFFPDSDELVQQYDDVTYRIGSGLNLGVLQILPSPWNRDRVVFVMTGTSEQGQVFGGRAIFDNAFGRAPLNGNIVFVGENDANSVDTRFIFEGVEILQEGINTRGEVAQPPTATPRAQEEPTQVPTLLSQAELTAEVNALATGIFTEAPENFTPTPLPTLPPLPTREGLLGGESAIGGAPSWLNIVLIVLGSSIVVILVAGAVRALRSRNE